MFLNLNLLFAAGCALLAHASPLQIADSALASIPPTPTIVFRADLASAAVAGVDVSANAAAAAGISVDEAHVHDELSKRDNSNLNVQPQINNMHALIQKLAGELPSSLATRVTSAAASVSSSNVEARQDSNSTATEIEQVAEAVVGYLLGAVGEVEGAAEDALGAVDDVASAASDVVDAVGDLLELVSLLVQVVSGLAESD
ncbi:hypothetical protein WOLCODRAFT_138388 [Wolfiporia cocos MD-104 SS10]|uniref:Uncharacterized protein n=1 Tax=Wolfiporia cocos (strain MD-104) TaxID=742152 RepID=A0A2H3JMW2_WOLCO|nr:hypothetical protein WOLCODRAFT_138388 [Wolfiporia cocos MD-104 SS10]